MKRLTGLGYVVSSDTKFVYKGKSYSSLYQKIDEKTSSVTYSNMVGQKLIKFIMSPLKNLSNEILGYNI